MGKTRAQIQADYRERKRLKMGQAAFLKAESERQKKYYIPVARLTKRVKKERRESVNTRVRKHRALVKQAQEIAEERLHTGDNIEPPADVPNVANLGDINDSDSAISDVSDVAGLRVKLQFKKRISTRKRTSRSLSKAHRRIEQLQLKLQASQKQNKTISKRYERASKKNIPAVVPVSDGGTPRSKTASELRNAGLSPKSVPKNLKKKLTFTNAVLDEIREAKKHNKKTSEKSVLNQIVSGKVVKRYRLLRYTSMQTGLKRKSLAQARSKNVTQGIFKPQIRQSWRVLHDEVLNFLSRDDNSRLMPGKKDACKSGNTKSQIRVLNDYLGNLYLKYKGEHVDQRHVSLTAFQRIRKSQPHIKLVQFTSRNTSLCQRHQNFALKLKTLKRLGLVANDNPDEFIKNNDDDAVKDIMSKLGDESEVQYEEWKRVSTDQGKKKTKLQIVVSKGSEFTDRFQTESSEFRQHVERVKAQYNAAKLCKENLTRDECYVQMDFAENYTCIPLEEVQSGYWNQEGVTLHPMVMYYRDESDTVQHQSFVAVSDEKGHNAATILTIIKDLLPRILKVIPALKRIHYWTDSPTAQYRNKTIFSVVSDHHELFGVFASWNYFEAGHGKGPCDGIGGTVKRLADEAVKRQSAVIQDAHDFYAWASQEREDSAITYCFVSKEDCSLTAKEIDQKWSSVKSIAGTLKLHAVIGIGNQTLLIRDLSCYCNTCCVHSEINPTSSMCDGWVTHKLTRSSSSTENASVHNEVGNTLPLSPNESLKPVYQSDDWVAAIYDECWFVGQVLQADDQDVHINFMTTGSGKLKGNTFKWPLTEDKIWVSHEQVLCHIDAPRRLSKRLFDISSEQADSITEKHMLLKAKRLSELNT